MERDDVENRYPPAFNVDGKRVYWTFRVTNTTRTLEQHTNREKTYAHTIVLKKNSLTTEKLSNC